MATFRKLASGQWQAGVNTPEKLPSGEPKRVYKTHPLKSVVSTWAKTLEAQIAAGQWRDPHSGDMILSDWRREWRANRTAEGATTRKDDSHWRCHIAPKWAGWPLNTITRQELRAWVKEMHERQCPVCRTTPRTRTVDGKHVLVKHPARGKPCSGSGKPVGLSAATVQGAALSLSAILTGAVNLDPPLLQVNPMAGLKLPSTLPKPIFWWTRDEASRIVAAAEDDQARLMIDLDIHTGLRLGELLGLKRRYIENGGHGRLIIQVAGVETRDGWKDHPKSSKSNRPVPVPKHLTAPLLKHIDGLGPDDHVFTAPGGGGGREVGDGAAWDDRNWSRRVFEPAVAAAGVRRGTPHDMRHTAASWLVQKGVDLYKVQALLGHESYRTTQRYAHLQPEAFGKVYDAWDELSDTGTDHDAATIRHLLDTRTDLSPAQREALTGLLKPSPVPLDVFDDDSDDPIQEAS